MSACCRTCKSHLDGVKSDHTLLGSGIDIDSDMDGFICLALAYEGVAYQPEHGCEFCYYKRFDARAYPCSLCIFGEERTDMFQPKMKGGAE